MLGVGLMMLVGAIVALGKHPCPSHSFQDLYLKLKPHSQHLHLVYVASVTKSKICCKIACDFEYLILPKSQFSYLKHWDEYDSCTGLL